MSKEQEQQEHDEPVIDLEALQASIDGIDDAELDEGQEDDVIEDEEFDLDQALDSDVPIVLEGKITEEQAIEKAKERGWREDGKDKFGHQISAIEFLERTPLFHKMDLLRGDVEELKRSNKKLAEHTKAVAQKAVEDAKKQADKFRAEKERLLNEEVLDRDDIEKLRTLDKQIEESSVVETDDTEAVNEEIVTRYEEAKPVFMDENKEWYRKDYDMTTLADQTGTKFAEEHLKEHGVLPEPEVTFKHVLEVVKAQYPDMGKPKRGTKVTTRQNRTVANKPKTKRTLADLPEDQQPIAKMVMEASGLSEEEYLKNYEF